MDNKFHLNFNPHKFFKSNNQSLQLKKNLQGMKTINQGKQIQTKTFLQNLKTNLLLRNSFKFPGLTNINMTTFFGQEKSTYMKELMNLPKNMKDILVMTQNTSQNPVTAAAVTTKNLSNLLSSNINLPALADIMKNNGKEAVAKLISAMAENTKQGIDNSLLKDTMKIINSSISASTQENQTQIIKNFMLLYLPWLPLQEGKDFELEIEAENSEPISDAILTILISTVNYGNINILVVSSTPSAFEVSFKCTKKFPKKKFNERINKDNKKHSIQSNIIFEEKEEQFEGKKNHQAKVSMTNLKEVTPYMLIFTNTLIRNVIELDNEKNKMSDEENDEDED